ncbi:SAM-dependent methyltransferase [Micromonospora sp. KC721]|uniref:SAM-dependent methyltransferase n=1 Tax=Micromonospora sp. KC721 TaxID=2530380 RepID=UPI00104C898A|nr:SAM-dependent methyltransferase [Micromonospora sp. KC721]TDB82483.1 hypothetical protein E1182_01510 [Micromonospora sp. KC721]
MPSGKAVPLDQHRIVVVGLGPGPRDMACGAAVDAVRTAGSVFTTAPEHPAMSNVSDGVALPSTDPPAAARLLLDAAAKAGSPSVLAVPGSPYVLEPVVAWLVRRHRAVLRVIPGTSFLDLLWQRIGIDPFHRAVRVRRAAEVNAASVRQGGLVVAELTRRWISAAARLPDIEAAAPVTVAHRLGLPGESVAPVTWADLEYIDIGPYSSLYIHNGEFGSESALAAALRAQHRGAGMGFGLPDLAAALADVEDEVAEARADPNAAEVGDILFAAVQVARQLGVDPDDVLIGAVGRFVARLDYIDARGEDLAAASPKRLRELWAEAKRGAASRATPP